MIIKWVAMPLAALAIMGAAPEKNDGAKVTLSITNLRNGDGLVRACMTTEAARFPDCRGAAGAYTASVDAHKGSITLVFNNVKPGRYAIALLHDQNSNGKADRALAMVPKEGFGFSRDAPVRMGPPSFGDAAFDMGEQDRAMTIRMRYLL